MTGLTHTLKEQILQSITLTRQNLELMKNSPHYRELRTQLSLEEGLFHHFFHEAEKASVCLSLL
jgi:hypothetical protein